jgi:hypothetical protein
VTTAKPPFRFDLSGVLKRLRSISGRVDGVSLRLPFISINVKADDLDVRIAREIVIRLADRRVLNAFECCDSCVANALASLAEIRAFLVDKQVELGSRSDGALFLLTEMMLEAIRQFLTFEERLRRRVSAGGGRIDADDVAFGSAYPLSHIYQSQYFAALEMLRGHLYRTLRQIASFSNFEVPVIPVHMRYDDTWQIEAYSEFQAEDVGASGTR